MVRSGSSAEAAMAMARSAPTLPNGWSISAMASAMADASASDDVLHDVLHQAIENSRV